MILASNQQAVTGHKRDAAGNAIEWSHAQILNGDTFVAFDKNGTQILTIDLTRTSDVRLIRERDIVLAKIDPNGRDVHVGTRKPKPAAPSLGQKLAAIHAKATQTERVRRFTHVNGFKDRAQYIEVGPRGSFVVTKDGQRHPDAWFTLAKCQEFVKQGSYREIPVLSEPSPEYAAKVQATATKPKPVNAYDYLKEQIQIQRDNIAKARSRMMPPSYVAAQPYVVKYEDHGGAQFVPPTNAQLAARQQPLPQWPASLNPLGYRG